MNANCLDIDYTNNPRLKEILSPLQPGETIELRMTLQMERSDEQKAQLRIKKIVAPDTIEMNEEDDDGAVRPDANEPAMIVMRTGKKSNASESASDTY